MAQCEVIFLKNCNMQMIIIIQKLYESIFLSPVTGVAVVFNEVYETLMDILTSSGVVKKNHRRREQEWRWQAVNS